MVEAKLNRRWENFRVSGAQKPLVRVKPRTPSTEEEVELSREIAAVVRTGIRLHQQQMPTRAVIGTQKSLSRCQHYTHISQSVCSLQGRQGLEGR